ncbi:MAG: hypothetical protein WD468_04755 [Pirellulales bacterium]
MAVEDAATDVTRRPLPATNADHAQRIRKFQNMNGNAVKHPGMDASLVEIGANESSDEWLFRVKDSEIGTGRNDRELGPSAAAETG